MRCTNVECTEVKDHLYISCLFHVCQMSRVPIPFHFPVYITKINVTNFIVLLAHANYHNFTANDSTKFKSHLLDHIYILTFAAHFEVGC